MTTRLPNLGLHEEETARLKIAFSEAAAGRQAGTVAVAHVESILHLATQPNSSRAFRQALIPFLEEAIAILRNTL